MGPVGSGQLTKMVNQICIAGLLQGLSEAVSFAQRAGLEVDEVVDVVGQEQRKAGRWTIVRQRWRPESSILVSPLSGC